MLLDSAKLKTKSGSVNILIDDKGTEYRVPIYCINEPSNAEFQKQCWREVSKTGGGKTGEVTLKFHHAKPEYSQSL